MSSLQIRIRSRCELKALIGVNVMNLLRQLVCLLIGHAPIVERRGNDSVLACERCRRFFAVFVKGIYGGKTGSTHRVGIVEE